MSKHVSCESCRHYLGGGQCRINLEAECREGGGFEAWESKEQQNEDGQNCSECEHFNIMYCECEHPLQRNDEVIKNPLDGADCALFSRDDWS